MDKSPCSCVTLSCLLFLVFYSRFLFWALLCFLCSFPLTPVQVPSYILQAFGLFFFLLFFFKGSPSSAVQFQELTFLIAVVEFLVFWRHLGNLHCYLSALNIISLCKHKKIAANKENVSLLLGCTGPPFTWEITPTPQFPNKERNKNGLRF